MAALDREQPSELSTHRLAADVRWFALQERALAVHPENARFRRRKLRVVPPNGP